jgi:3-isopropylmalate dehydrogenase
MYKKIALLPGDGIGPEVIKEAVKVLNVIAEKFNHQFEYIEALIGAVAIEHTGNPFPTETEKICKESDAILFGAIGSPIYDNNPNAKIRPEQGLLAMRKSLELYANIRPVSYYESITHLSPLKESIIKGTDMVIFRELTSGIYFGEKGTEQNGEVAFDECRYSSLEIQRIAKKAFINARTRRKKLTLVDKANVLETSRLWRKEVMSMAKKYPDVEVNFMFVDNAAMQMILNPRQFDVILTENMFGDIISDEASVIGGSIGLLPSASLGEKHALYEPIHGSYYQAAGKNIANPVAAILSAAMMLEFSFGLEAESEIIKKAVSTSIDNGFVTSDINPDQFYPTDKVGDAISELVASSINENINSFIL